MDDLVVVVPVAVYPAMLGGTIAGQFAGMGFDALALGTHAVWMPLACSVLLEALVGARYGAARLGHPLTRSERGRLSVYYSLGLVAVSLPLWAWLATSRASREGVSGAGPSPHAVALGSAVLLGGLVVYTGVRFALMTAFSRRPA
jgi:hypothetical protein